MLHIPHSPNRRVISAALTIACIATFVGVIVKTRSFWSTTYGTSTAPSLKDARSRRPEMKEAYGKLPMSFEVNRGQTDARVKYLARGSGYS
nr:hypothetical protein [Acidobacteriota bacterium]